MNNSNTAKNSFSIKEWAIDDRPREKLLKNGWAALSNAELIAILIGSGNRELSAVDLSKKILHDHHNNLNELARLSLKELMLYKGIGEAKAISIVAALELGRRRGASKVLEKQQIQNSNDLFQLFYPMVNDLSHEEFWIALLDDSHKIIETKRLFQGGSQQVVVDVPMILKYALQKSAQAIAVAHNHPSGQLLPSSQDNIITQKIQQGCNAIGIRMIDHIIVANGRYISYADKGLL